MFAPALCAASAFADVDATSNRKATYVEHRIERGRHALASADPFESRASQLQDIRRAVRYFRQARAEAVRDIPRSSAFADMTAQTNDLLATALVQEARIYFDRGSLPLARERVDEALVLAPGDRDATYLMEKLDVSRRTDYSTVAGHRVANRFVNRSRFIR